MANRDYIPASEAEMIAWLKRFATWFTTNGASHGFTPAEVTEVVTLIGDADTAAGDCDIKEAAYRAGVQTKRNALAGALALTRADVKRLQAAPTMTDADRADAGITVPDAQPTKSSEETVRELTLPILILDWSKPLQVILHWGTNPGDESNNAKPPNILGVQIQYHRGGIPAKSNPPDLPISLEHEADWLTLDIDTRSPYIHIVHDDVPTTYAYRVCWMDNKGNKGPYCAPAVCTVSV